MASTYPELDANATIGQIDKLGSLAGTVRDGDGARVAYALVVASHPYGSIYGRADSSGNYRIGDVPASVQLSGSDVTIAYAMTASQAGFRGQSRISDDSLNEITVTPGGTTTIDFVVHDSNEPPPPPPDPFPPLLPDPFTLQVNSWTTPAAGQPAGRLIEITVNWYDCWAPFISDNYAGLPPDYISGFTIYRSAASPDMIPANRIGFARNPQLTNFYDTSAELSPGTAYYYRIGAVNARSLNGGVFNPEAELLPLSEYISVAPLDLLQESLPQEAAVLPMTPPTFSWTALSGAQSYIVYLFDRYPELLDTGSYRPRPDQVVQPMAVVGPVAGASVTSPYPIPLPGTYYWVAIAADNANFNLATAYAIGELRSFTAQ